MLTRKIISDVLSTRGIAYIATSKQIADVLNLSPVTVRQARTKGKLKTIDRDSFEFESIVDWLQKNPRYLTKINNITTTKTKQKD